MEVYSLVNPPELFTLQQLAIAPQKLVKCFLCAQLTNVATVKQ